MPCPGQVFMKPVPTLTEGLGVRVDLLDVSRRLFFARQGQPYGQLSLANHRYALLGRGKGIQGGVNGALCGILNGHDPYPGFFLRYMIKHFCRVFDKNYIYEPSQKRNDCFMGKGTLRSHAGNFYRLLNGPAKGYNFSKKQADELRIQLFSQIAKPLYDLHLPGRIIN